MPRGRKNASRLPVITGWTAAGLAAMWLVTSEVKESGTNDPDSAVSVSDAKEDASITDYLRSLYPGVAFADSVQANHVLNLASKIEIAYSHPSLQAKRDAIRGFSAYSKADVSQAFDLVVGRYNIYVDPNLRAAIRADPVDALLRSGTISGVGAAVAFSAFRWHGNYTKQIEEANRLASKWVDADGRTPLRGMDIYKGDVVVDKSGTLMRIEHPTPWTSYGGEGEVTSSRSHVNEFGHTVSSERVSPGISPGDAAYSRQQQWRSENYAGAAEDFRGFANTGVNVMNEAAQRGSQAAHHLGSAAAQLSQNFFRSIQGR
jgi:hypothetical protein